MSESQAGNQRMLTTDTVQVCSLASLKIISCPGFLKLLVNGQKQAKNLLQG